eukprot:CAMPEP_0113593098 /NCGR_PEP_ID=MMETSP0015_2-20120614/38230_1 /TAXON_ID=2838 /ORGANISM="Odontella" /LENGTH=690 /DNA_ID=CAMNT_0000499741 /DNA_START=152 /DNA_END=2224 /DNA_ORIENTATION=+ /assembly_acc=CAM_ASM_000160
MTAKELWSSRTAFLFAAIGAAVGFGNIWRFPALAYEYGGGAFFVPYALALTFVGIPMLVLEIAMGQHRRTGDVGCFGDMMHERLRGIGLSSVLCGFFVTAYYVPLIAWVTRAFFESFGRMKDDWEDMDGSDATAYFYDRVIGMSTLDGDDVRPTRVVWTNVFYLFVVWSIIGTCLAFGIKWTGRIAYVTMGLPIVLLVFFFARAVTLPGASVGIHAYIGQWDLSVLRDRPDVWSTAVTQIFFSLGVTFGVMTAFGSHCPRDAPARDNSIIIALANSFFSFVSGFAVFGVLGYLKQYQEDDDANFDDIVQSGPFGAYPAALSTVPGGLYWVRFLFFNLFLLGIDSAFALTEGVVSVLKDSALGATASHRTIVCGTVSFGFMAGLLYVTDSGLFFLDVIDFYVNFVMLLVGFVKTFSAGWIYGMTDQIEALGSKVVLAYIGTTFGSVMVASCIWFGMDADTALAGFVVLCLCHGAGMYYCDILLVERVEMHPGRGWTLPMIRRELMLGNVLKLKDELEGTVGPLSYGWAVLIKHFIPPTLLVLFFNLACAKNTDGQSDFGHFAGYEPWPFQILGISAVIVVVLVFVVGAVRPRYYDVLVSNRGRRGGDDDELSSSDAAEVAAITAAGYKNAADTDSEHSSSSSSSSKGGGSNGNGNGNGNVNGSGSGSEEVSFEDDTDYSELKDAVLPVAVA